MMISQQQVNKCFEEIKSKWKQQQQIQNIINSYKPIHPPVLDSISLAIQSNPPQITNYNAFVPSSDLLKTYQSTFEKANQNQRIVNTTNYKLKANFGQPAPKNNRIQQFTSTAPIADQPIIVEQKQANIFQRLKEKQVTATIPNMQQSLFKNELSNLQKKQVFVQHTLPLSQWKKLRAKLSTQ